MDTWHRLLKILLKLLNILSSLWCMVTMAQSTSEFY